MAPAQPRARRPRCQTRQALTGSLALGCLASLTIVPLGAQSPAGVAAMVFRHQFKYPGISSPTYHRVYALHADGSFTALYAGITNPLNLPQQIETPVDGTYTYAKTGADTATLTVTPDGPGAETFELTFTSPGAGSIFIPSPPTSGAFTLHALPLSDPLVNTSQRAWASAEEPIILGFIVPAGQTTLFLIRAVGPGLAAFPDTTPAQDPRLEVYRDQTLLAANDDWDSGDAARSSDALRATTIATGTLTGAFPLADGSRDAAIVMLLDPGNYTVHVRTAPGEPLAEVLGEVYALQ